MTPRRLLCLAVVTLAATGVFAASAAADSLVYIKDSNVWLSNADGSGAYQVTLDGTAAVPYESPSQADDSTIVALRNRQLYRMTQSGGLLNAPINTPAPGTGALDPKVSPDGRYVAYWFATFVGDPLCYFCPPGLATLALISHSERFTAGNESGLTPNTGQWPSWASNDTLLLSQGAADEWFYRLGQNEGWDWWADFQAPFPPPVPAPNRNLSQGDVSRNGGRIAVVRGDSQESIAVYQSNGPPPGPSSPNPPAPLCVLGGDPGDSFRSPTWSNDGSMLAVQDPAGVETVRFTNFSPCTVASAGVIAGATTPDFGPAAINPGPRPACGNPGNPAACQGPPCTTCGPPCTTCSQGGTLKDQLRALLGREAKALAKLKLRGLIKRGLKVTFTAPGPGTLSMKLAKKSSVLASGRHVYTAAGKGTLTLKLSKKGKKVLRHARKAKLTLTASFTPKGGKATTVKQSLTLKR
jgi:hypothetical protein